METQLTPTCTHEPLIRVSFFPRVADTDPVQRILPVSRLFHGLVSRVREPGIPLPGQEVQDCIPVASGARYPEGVSRRRDHVVDVQAVWVNINNSVLAPTDEYWPELDGSISDRPKTKPTPVPDPLTISDVVMRMERAGIASAIHTTRSNTPECPRFCAMIPLAEAIPPELLPQATDWILERLGIYDRLHCVNLDQLRNPAGINNLPTIPLCGPLVWHVVDGTVLEVPVEQIRGRPLLERPIPDWLVDLNHRRTELATTTVMNGPISIDPAEWLMGLGCHVSPERPWRDGTRRRTTCPWAREHVRGIGDDCAVIIYLPGGSPVWICGDMCHRHLGIADLIRAKRGA